MESDKVEKKTKQQLKEQYENLNPAELKRRIDKLQEKLSKLYLKRQRENAITDRISRISNTQNETDFENNNFSEATKQISYRKLNEATRRLLPA